MLQLMTINDHLMTILLKIRYGIGYSFNFFLIDWIDEQRCCNSIVVFIGMNFDVSSVERIYSVHSEYHHKPIESRRLGAFGVPGMLLI